MSPDDERSRSSVDVEADEADGSVPLVRTKLAAPITAPGLLSRPTLLQPLRSAGRVVVVTAPAGWGKTSLLSTWQAAERDRRRFAYVRLGPGDDRPPSVFWSYVIEAFRCARPEIAPDAEAVLHRPVVDLRRELVPALANELGAIDELIMLVLDDYHAVTSPEVHEAVVELIENLPPAVGVAVASRSDPPFPLARWRASGELVEIRATHLAFGPIETATFLNHRFGIDLDPATAATLCERAEGWPAGLQLAGLSLMREPDPAAFVDRFAGDDRNVADYLVGEVISTLDEGRRDFLLRTAVLDELCGPLCDAVSGGQDSDVELAALERDGMFLIPLDRCRRWYRYHHLFRDWLQHELQATDPAAVPDLHRRASEWHSATGTVDAAIDHALAVPDADRAAELVARHLGTWEGVQWPQVWRWLDRLPDEVVSRHPAVALARSRLAFETGEFGRGLVWAEAAEAGLDSLPAPARAVMATHLKLWHAFAHLVEGDMDAALTLANGVADAERPRRSADYAGAVGLAGMTTFWLIGALESVPPLTEGAAARADTGLEDGGVTPLLALAHAEVGDWSAAEAVAERAMALPHRDERNRYPDAMAAHYALGLVALGRGDRAEGVARIELGLELARAWVEPVFVAYGCLLRADASDDFAEKRALVREARELVAGAARRGRITDLIDAEARKLSLRQPHQDTAGTVFVEPLTDRELEVVRLLRSDLSLREIGNELYLAHNTVKSYTRSIYRKLGVSSRETAVAVATDLDLG
ncbi:MAG: LuxR C-terminal-related transcriptional regulator [Actinomycetota bacterium]